MSQSLETIVKSVVSDMFNVPAESLQDSSSPETLEKWDSVGHLNLVLALEQRLAIQFDPEDIVALHNVGEIIAFARRKIAPQT